MSEHDKAYIEKFQPKGVKKMSKEKGFCITDGKGFHMAFKNGNEISVQWGPGNYCDNRRSTFGKQRNVEFYESDTAEIAVLNSKGEWLTREIAKKAGFGKINDDVMGYLSADDVLRIMIETAK